MASLAATAWPKPLVLVPCLSWSTASAVFTEVPVATTVHNNQLIYASTFQGVMSNAIDWKFLQNQYFSDNRYYDVLSKLCKVIDDPLESNLGKTGYSFGMYHTINLQSSCLFVSDFSPFPKSVHDQIKQCSTLTPYEILSLLNENCCTNYSDTSNVMLSYNIRTLKITLGTVLAKFLTEEQTRKSNNKHALWFMRGLMDECTHLKNFSCPHTTSLIIALSALSDGYVPRDGVSRLEDLWPGATVRYLKGGHVSSYITNLKLFR